MYSSDKVHGSATHSPNCVQADSVETLIVILREIVAVRTHSSAWRKLKISHADEENGLSAMLCSYTSVSSNHLHQPLREPQPPPATQHIGNRFHHLEVHAELEASLQLIEFSA